MLPPSHHACLFLAADDLSTGKVVKAGKSKFEAPLDPTVMCMVVFCMWVCKNTLMNISIRMLFWGSYRGNCRSSELVGAGRNKAVRVLFGLNQKNPAYLD
jgi:hypothetical protein